MSRKVTNILALAMAFLACAINLAIADGRFVGDVTAKWLPNGRDMELTEPFAYVDAKGVEWSVPKGAVVDGASIPRALWSIVGPPFTGKYRKSSVVHDHFAATMSRPWQDVHEAFYQAALTEGNSILHSKLMYGAVYAWGPRWDYVGGKPVRTREIVRSPLDQEFAEFADWVKRNDPSLEVMRSHLAQAFPRGRPPGERRVALVIGNSAYINTPKLPNPANDAADVAATFKELGYKVILGVDLDKASMDRHIKEFAEALGEADAGMFFYAGHGLQVNGQNYLVPIEAKLERPSGIDFEMVRLDLVQRTMEGEGKTNIIFLDACRDNPLARNLARALGTRSTQIGRGLAAVESGAGTLISFSTQPGNVALDGTGRNSPYSEALVKHIKSAALKDDLSSLLISVRRDVISATKSKQVPWEHSALTSRFFLNLNAEQEIQKPQLQHYDKEMEIVFWNAVKDSKDLEVINSYLERYPNGNFSGLARVWVARLQKESEASKQLLHKEEELRRAEEAKKQADIQKAEELRKLEELKRKDELAKAQADAQKAIEAARAAEADRQAALARAAEAEKIAAAAKKAKEAADSREAELRRSEQEKKLADAKRIEELRKLEEGKEKELSRARAEAQKAIETAKEAETQRLAALKAAEESRKAAEAANALQEQTLRKQQEEAEAKRIAEAKKADELRKLEASKVAEAENEKVRLAALARKAEEASQAAEVQRLEALKAAEAARKTAEDEKAREAEAARLRAEELKHAALQSKDDQSGPAEPPDSKVLIRAVQVELKRIGCDPGTVDGHWGEKGKLALRQYSRLANVAIKSDVPDASVLQSLTSQKTTVCTSVCLRGQILVAGKCVPKTAPAMEKDSKPSNAPLAQGEKNCRKISGVAGPLLAPCSEVRGNPHYSPWQ